MQDVELYRKLKGVKKVSIAVIGDVILDKYVHGHFSRISPEAPVGIIDSTHEEYKLGGAANVAGNLQNLGCTLSLIGVTGHDADSKILKELLNKQGIKSSGIFPSKDRPTIIKTRILAQNQQILRIDKELRKPLPAEVERKLLAYVRKILPRLDGIILSDYGKGLLSKSFLKSVIALARKNKKPVIVDPKGESFEKYRGATVITPNRIELEKSSGIPCKNEKNVAKAAKAILRKCSISTMLATLGADGMAIFEKGNSPIFFPTVAKEVFDVTGAGDTVVAVFAACWLGGLSQEEAARLANHAGALQVAHLGAVGVGKDEIERSLAGIAGYTEPKIIDSKTAAEIAKSLKKQKKKIVFTNGCFDILHYGHIQYLQKAKKLGHSLIVGLNSDRSVKRLKGSSRPLLSENDRAHILAALDCVDHVVIFDEGTPLKLINAVKPDILVKGGDYKANQIVGHKEIKKWGGAVKIVSYVKGNSTTGIIKKIIRNQSAKK